MPINDFCKEQYIDFNAIDLISDRFNLTKVWTYKNQCKCNNYIYIPENLSTIKVYYKNTFDPIGDQKVNALVYDGENLTEGFTNKIII